MNDYPEFSMTITPKGEDHYKVEGYLPWPNKLGKHWSHDTVSTGSPMGILCRQVLDLQKEVARLKELQS